MKNDGRSLNNIDWGYKMTCDNINMNYLMTEIYSLSKKHLLTQLSYMNCHRMYNMLQCKRKGRVNKLILNYDITNV